MKKDKKDIDKLSESTIPTSQPGGFFTGPGGDKSSKRLGAMFSLLVAASISFIGLLFLRDVASVLSLVWTWLSAALALWGIAAWSKT